MLGICRMLLRDRAEAEDASQQTWLSAYRSLLAGTRPEHPAAWLATIARNECRARVEQRMRQPVPEEMPDEIASPLPGPVDAAARSADLAALVAAIGALPAQQRDALLMREFAGLSYARLAAALSVSEPAVESLLVRARRELRIRLQPVYAASAVPLVVLRDWLARLGSAPESALESAAKVGAVPLAAKLAVGVTSVALIGGAVVTGDGSGRRTGIREDVSAVIGVADADAGVRAARAAERAPVRRVRVRRVREVSPESHPPAPSTAGAMPTGGASSPESTAPPPAVPPVPGAAGGALADDGPAGEVSDDRPSPGGAGPSDSSGGADDGSAADDGGGDDGAVAPEAGDDGSGGEDEAEASSGDDRGEGSDDDSTTPEAGSGDDGGSEGPGGATEPED